MNLNIKQLPIKNSLIITVFKGYGKYSISSSGTVCDGRYVESEFSNKKLSFQNHSLHKIGTEITKKKLTNFCQQNNLKSQKEGASGEDIIIDFLLKQGYDLNLKENDFRKEELYVIIPKTYKKTKGTVFKNTFNICSKSFLYGAYIDIDLDVYMTPIKIDVKRINFRVDIPDYIYDKCMEDTDIKNRPKVKYIESENLSYIHNRMYEYSYQAISIHLEQSASEKYNKKIFVRFLSSETSERDEHNFAYTGQKISTFFNWFIAYEYLKPDLIGNNKKYFTFLKKESDFSSVRPRHDLQKNINGVVDLETINGKCYFYTPPKGVILDWTQERENFCRDIENNFRKLSENLNNFLSNLDNDKIDLLITNSNFKFLNQ
jgi:hypothetical protein